MQFVTAGMLPVAAGRWYVREAGGYIWFVNEDRAVSPYVMLNGVVTPVVDWADDPTAPLIVPKPECVG